MIRVQQADFNLTDEYDALRADCPKIGAITTFVGLMRDFNEATTSLHFFSSTIRA